mmetsp:Transcript_11790/g.30265  ORF Transcript_11790/g.30265 Transcript_11790/m.30265 type:complete len:176 (-) Transcript_11790:261-788(-)
MSRRIMLLLASVVAACSFSLPASSPPAHSGRSGASCMQASPGDGFFGLFMGNMQQIADQRVAQISHVMLRTDEQALNIRTKGECYELLSSWKEVIEDESQEGTVLERFQICARERSECASKAKDGMLGFKMRGQVSTEFAEVCFDNDAVPGTVYGPVLTEAGLHLVYLHSLKAPM